MKYYKLIDNNNVIGVISSNDFIYYSPIVDCFLRGSEENGEYISFQNRLYRTTWMNPITVTQDYTNIRTIEIEASEYEIFMAALQSNQPIEEEEEEKEEIIEETQEDLIYQSTLDFIRSSKIKEMSAACRRTIEEGFSLELRSGAHHFSLTTQDQLNLMSLSMMAQTQDLIPYHADGEECIFYTSDEINLIVETATNLKIYQTTYYNSLKNYINALETIEEIAAIEYGIPIPNEYKSDALRMIEM